tara:strand:- start:297 stop:1550 length:1254 start_codon:yes stop_codon:yes gene_type:complete
MDYFIYNNITFKINDSVLLKHKSRILPYFISFIELKNEEYYLVKCINKDYDYLTKTIKLYIGTNNKFIKKYFIYEEPPIIKCTLLKSKHTVYKFHCDFCNLIHKHNYLGQQDCRCISIYSPYNKNGYILEYDLGIKNFNEYLLYNFELYLQKLNLGGWSSYKLSIKKFYEGKVCEDYGKKHFPYITNSMIEYIKIYYSEDNFKCSKGCLVAGLKSIIKMILSKNLLYFDENYKTEANKLYKFYKKNNKVKDPKFDKIKKLRQILSTYKPLKNEKIKKIEIKKTEIKETKIKETEIKETEIKETEIKETEIKKEEVKEIINGIELDVDCGMEEIEKLSNRHKNNIKNMIYEDYELKDKYFYLPDDVKLYSSYLNSYEDLWLCICKLEETEKKIIYCVDEVDSYDPDFINYRLELRENL